MSALSDRRLVLGASFMLILLMILVDQLMPRAG
jgi:hypothetical protein